MHACFSMLIPKHEESSANSMAFAGIPREYHRLKIGNIQVLAEYTPGDYSVMNSKEPDS
jgi:hypothetical protein